MAAKKKPAARQEVAATPEQDELGVAEPEDLEALPPDDPGPPGATGEAGEDGDAEELAAGQAAEDEANADQDSGPSMDVLYARASELKIKGRRLMARRELIEAIALAEAEGSVPAVDEPGGPGEPPEATTEQATTEQAQRIIAATDEQLQGVVDDPKFPPHLLALVIAELGRRALRLQHGQQLAARMGPMERYIVVKGGRYISKDGYATHLAEGTLVTPNTHDLNHVHGQGIRFRPAEVVATRLDEMGRQISEVK